MSLELRQVALRFGADVHIHPTTLALQAGGLAMLKAWSGPFGDIRFCPTGGITAGNAGDFLALPNVVCVGGSWLVPLDAIARNDWPAITRLAVEAVELRS